ncbi:MAG: 23S rRNA (uracil(1939)-C(5))-methyltransferase RlmD [Clostridia bacterium]|nr:23S rRNA (uracil(1939)-C(5))-methyltransferase RlmD [Clostridia bacterium]
MLVKNQEIDVVIESVGSDAQGIARVDGFVVFVPFAIKGETVKVHIIKTTKNYAVGKIIALIKPSKERVNVPCPVYGKCGGCALQHCSYQEALKVKKQIVKDAIHKIGGFYDQEVNDVVGSNYCYGYRNKASFPLFVNNDGDLEVCMFRGLSHDPIYINDCHITMTHINIIAEIFKNFVNKVYSLEQKNKLKHLVVRYIDGKALVTIVSQEKPIKFDNLFDLMMKALGINENMLGLFWCKKSKDNNVILEGEITHLLGIRNILTEFMGISVEVSPLSFFQINIDIMQKIYKEVVQGVKEGQVVVDAYSGAGLLSALISKKAKSVYGIEIVPEATKNANSLKKQNNIDNLVNINGDVSQELPKLVEKIGKDFTLVLDPPRKGVDERVINTILGVLPKNILYVSCNPASLARDLKMICKGGYKIEEIIPFDMFPQTAHIESFVKLSKM